MVTAVEVMSYMAAPLLLMTSQGMGLPDAPLERDFGDAGELLQWLIHGIQ